MVRKSISNRSQSKITNLNDPGVAMYGRIFQMKDKDGEEDNVISLLKTQARQRIEGVIATYLVALDNSSVNS